MKIWLMNHYATSMYKDRAGRHYWFAKQLKQKGYDVTVFCATTFLNGNETIDTNGEKYTVKELDGIPFVFVKTVQSVGNGIKRVLNMGCFYENLFPVSKAYAQQNGKPDVILASSVHPLTMQPVLKLQNVFMFPVSVKSGISGLKLFLCLAKPRKTACLENC